MANGHSTEGDLTASHRGLVLDIALTDGDCPHGFIYVIIQDAYVDKINSFEAYFSYIHNNDKVFLYNNQHIVDYLHTLIQNNSSNSNLMQLLPTIINNLRLNKIDWDFFEYSTDYIKSNPLVTSEQFQNWFMTEREGNDGLYDENYWENPNLNFPAQNLPTLQNFTTQYPTIEGKALALLVGGDVLTLYNQYPNVVRGFCALKVSKGLNYSGVVIPNITTTNGNPGTVKGADGKYYFLNAKALNIWMQKTFGLSPSNPNHIRILGSQGGIKGVNVPALTSGIKGIYSLVSNNSNWASGHADFIQNGICTFGCHFYDTPPAPIEFIDIWKLN